MKVNRILPDGSLFVPVRGNCKGCPEHFKRVSTTQCVPVIVCEYREREKRISKCGECPDFYVWKCSKYDKITTIKECATCLNLYQ